MPSAGCCGPGTLPLNRQGDWPISYQHLGVTPWHIHSTLNAEQLCQQAALAESWGFDSFFLPESHFAGEPSLPEPMMLLSAIAATTSRIKLGTTSYLLPIRHPLQAAEQVACLDQLSAGRLILGLGRGFQPGMLEAFNVNGADKRTLFEESLATMRAAWGGEPVGNPDHELRLAPLPRQQPHPPLWVAAFGPKAIAQVGRLGLPYLASPMETLAELQDNHARHRSACEEAGHQPPQAVIVMRTVFVSPVPGRVASVREAMTSTPRPGFARQSDAAVDDWALLGDRADIAGQLRRYRKQLGMTHLIAVRPRIRGIDPDWHAESLQELKSVWDELAATERPQAP